MIGDSSPPRPIPSEFWRRNAVSDALSIRDLGALFRLLRQHAGWSQTIIGREVGMTQPEVSDYMRGKRRARDAAVLDRVADGLLMPDEARIVLGLAPRHHDTGPGHGSTEAGTDGHRPGSPWDLDTISEDQALVASRALHYLPSLASTLAIVTQLGRGDVKRRHVVTSAPFALAAFAAPVRDWLIATLDDGCNRPRQAGMQDVQAIREMFSAFQELDVLHGTGAGRRALAQYLTGHVIPLVRRGHKESVQLALNGVAAELTYLAGWMAFDAGDQGLAQRYLIQSLRLAQAANDPVLGSHVLAGMSDQATQLGHPEEGRRLARAGRQTLRRVDDPAALTDLYTLEARALATLSQTRECVATVFKAEKTFEKIDPKAEPEWARFIDEAYVFGEFAHSFRDIGDATNAARYATRSIGESMAQQRARRGALSQTVLAVSHTQNGDLEAAAHAGHQALDLALTVRSSRCAVALTDLRSRLEPHGQSRAVADFVHRLDAIHRLGVFQP